MIYPYFAFCRSHREKYGAAVITMVSGIVVQVTLSGSRHDRTAMDQQSSMLSLQDGGPQQGNAAVRPFVFATLPRALDVVAIRLSLPRQPYAVTQAEFARRFGFSTGALRDWEQGRRRPEAAARTLLLLIRHDSAGIEAAIRVASGWSDGRHETCGTADPLRTRATQQPQADANRHK